MEEDKYMFWKEVKGAIDEIGTALTMEHEFFYPI